MPFNSPCQFKASFLFVAALLSATSQQGCKMRTFGDKKNSSDVRGQEAGPKPEPKTVNWDKGDLKDSGLSALVADLNSKTGFSLSVTDFSDPIVVDQAHSRYFKYFQKKNGLELDGALLRVWRNSSTQELLQAEANVFNPSDLPDVKPALASTEAMDAVHTELASTFESQQLLGIRSSIGVGKGGLVRRIRVSTKRGHFTFDVSLEGGKILDRKFEALETATPGTYEVEASVYPLYEHADPLMTWPIVDLTLKPRVKVKLQNILQRRPDVDWKIMLDALGRAPFHYSKLAFAPPSAAQRSEGYWTEADWHAAFPPFSEQNGRPLPNTLGSPGAVAHLIGKNVGVFLHDKAPILQAEKHLSSVVHAQWRSPAGEDVLYPGITFMGRSFSSDADLARRPALDVKGSTREDDAAWLAASGFDEVQVYYSVDRFMETMRSFGFTDPKVSTLPFAAILFDPDIEMRNNAYYYLNTINFTTYSKGSLNYARDNTTIWHELGHGIQERLMADWHGDGGGGLSEGMADYLAELVVFAQLGRANYPEAPLERIANRMLFNATNEVHDEGEAYGGTMLDITLAAMQKWGFKEGLARSSDLVLETMRFTRDDPKLGVQKWFGEMAYVDGLERAVSGAPGRKPGEMRSLISTALAHRNFSALNTPASFNITLDDGTVLTDSSKGTPNAPVEFVADNSQKTFSFKVALQNGDTYSYPFPVAVRIVYPKPTADKPAVSLDGADKNFREYTLNSASETLTLEQTFLAKCNVINLADGGCRKGLTVEIYPSGDPLEKKALARKRIYFKVK